MWTLTRWHPHLDSYKRYRDLVVITLSIKHISDMTLTALIEKIQRADSTSSGIELGIVIVAAIGAAVPVVLVSVSVGMYVF